MSPRRVAEVLGATYLALGSLGFAVTGLTGFAAPAGAHLAWFGVNPLHNLVHLALGTGLLFAASASADVGRRALWGAALVLGAGGLLGFVVMGTPANVLALNEAANVLHLTSAFAALAALARHPGPSTPRR